MTDDRVISETSGLRGMALIQDEARRLPDAPGVYRMLGEGGEALYVGKAKSLKKRVTHYAQGRLFGEAMEAGKLLAILAAQSHGAAVPHHALLCAPTRRNTAAS